MGSGKTAVGTVLADRLRVPFRDTDDAIEAAARMTIAEIFARDGEPFFRAREAEVLRRLLGEGPGIVSTGGGAFVQEANRAAIAGNGVSIWLKASPDILWSRVRGRPGRPLLRAADPRAVLETLLAEREPDYAQADITVEAAPHSTIADMVDRVIANLEDHGELT